MNALQDWVANLPLMQQSVLMSAIRGPDGAAKKHKCKPLIRWFRRCVLVSAFDGCAINDPCYPGGGSFTGPTFGNNSHVEWEHLIKPYEDDFVDSRDELPLHYVLHFIHAVEILGYKHPDDRIGAYWNGLYNRLAYCFHMRPESKFDMNKRLGDNKKDWELFNDPSTTCSD